MGEGSTGKPGIILTGMPHDLVCWRCGVSLAELSLPLRRKEECPACRAELHVCRLCRAYDPHVTKKCREDGAEEVKHKDQANFCDWFKPRPGAFDAAGAAAERAAKAQLDSLFGGGRSAAAAPDPQALFGPPGGKDST
jgi:hypothetical protein